MIVTSCTAAQRCADSTINNKYHRITYRVSDEDFDNLFTDAVVTTSSFDCVTLCTTNQTNTYYDSNTRRCSCQDRCALYSPVITGTNYVDKFNTEGKPLCMNFQSNMSFLSSFWRTSSQVSLVQTSVDWHELCREVLHPR